MRKECITHSGEEQFARAQKEVKASACTYPSHRRTYTILPSKSQLHRQHIESKMWRTTLESVFFLSWWSTTGEKHYIFCYMHGLHASHISTYYQNYYYWYVYLLSLIVFFLFILQKKLYYRAFWHDIVLHATFILSI